MIHPEIMLQVRKNNLQAVKHNGQTINVLSEGLKVTNKLKFCKIFKLQLDQIIQLHPLMRTEKKIFCIWMSIKALVDFL